MGAECAPDVVPHLQWLEEQTLEIRERYMFLRAFAARQPGLARASYDSMMTVSAVQLEVTRDLQEYLQRWAGVPIEDGVPESEAYGLLSQWWIERTGAPLQEKIERAQTAHAPFLDALAVYSLAQTDRTVFQPPRPA